MKNKEHPYFKHLTRNATQQWSVPALCAAYSWPGGLAGGGTIGIIEMGGGWVESDIAAYFKSINQPVPTITDVSVDGTKNTYSPDQQGADYEVALDIEVAGASYFAATGKPANIRIYWTQDMALAIKQAQADGCAVLSISWGADEAEWSVSDVTSLVSAAQDATAAGMTIFAASGDNDSSDGGLGAANVDLPASCVYIVGCGGTTKTGTSETVWNNNPGKATGEGTGGGFSKLFSVPNWQVGIPTPPAKLGRMVPDCAANADPTTGYQIYVHGGQTVVGGTSAVAPLYAGLFAALNAKAGQAAAEFYTNLSDFVDVASGDNGTYKAAAGPDPCTGCGAPIGTKLAATFASAQPVPVPTPPPVPTPTPPPPPTPTPSVHRLVSDVMHVMAKDIDRGVSEPQMKADIQAVLNEN